MAIYAKIGGIEGNVTAEGWENWLEFDSFQFGAGRGISMSTGSGKEREATKPSISEVTLTKSADKASPKLFLEACVGKAIDSAEFDFVKTSEDKLETYFKCTLNDVLVSSYSVNSNGDDPSESISLAFTKVEVQYWPRKPDNTLGSPVLAGYDLQTGKKL